MRTLERVTDDKRRQSFYFPEDMLREIEDEAVRLERPVSWVVMAFRSCAISQQLTARNFGAKARLPTV